MKQFKFQLEVFLPISQNTVSQLRQIEDEAK